MDNNMLVKKVFTIGLLAAGLAACSGANNQINSNASGAGTTNTCGSSQNCVRVEFVDDPVINLNYSCSPVVNVTDETGVAICPANSRVEFYLQSTKSNRRVVFGSFLVAPAGQSLLRVTPLDLLSNREDVTQLNDPAATVAINVTRFLQALREHDRTGEEIEPFIATAPVNRIRITNALKDQLDLLTEDVQASDFASEQFATKLRPFLEASSRQLITPEQAQARLMTTLKAIKTGVYYGTPAITLPPSVGGAPSVIGLSNGDVNELALGIEGKAVADASSDANGLLRSTLALYGLVDREGAHIGQALQWTGRANTPEGVYNLYRQNDFEKLRPVNTLGGFDPITNEVSGQWRWSSVTNPQKIVDFNEGRLVRNFSMVGSQRIYQNLTAETTEPPAGTIGRWIQPSVSVVRPNGSSETLPEIKGTATISQVANVNTFFDRLVWRTKDTVESGQFVFPLHVTLRFRYGSVQSGCPQGGCTDLPNLSVTILENGNIISDFSPVENPLGANGNCASVDPMTLRDTTGVQEFRVGMVRAAYTGTDPSDAFIGPTMLFSGNVFGAHDGLQISTLAAAPRVKINVAGAISESTAATINMTDSSTEANTFGGQDPARWSNLYNAYLALRDRTGLSPAQQQQLEEATKRQQGTVTATVTPCYNTLNRTKPAPVSN